MGDGVTSDPGGNVSRWDNAQTGVESTGGDVTPTINTTETGGAPGDQGPQDLLVRQNGHGGIAAIDNDGVVVDPTATVQEALPPGETVDRALAAAEAALDGNSPHRAVALRNLNRAIDELVKTNGPNRNSTLTKLTAVLDSLEHRGALRSEVGSEALSVYSHVLNYTDPDARRALSNNAMARRGVRSRIRRNSMDLYRDAKESLQSFVTDGQADIATRLEAVDTWIQADSAREHTRKRGGEARNFFDVPEEVYQIVLQATGPRTPVEGRVRALRLLGEVRSRDIHLRKKNHRGSTGLAPLGREALLDTMEQTRRAPDSADNRALRRAALDALSVRAAGAYPLTSSQFRSLPLAERRLITAIQVAADPFRAWDDETIRLARFGGAVEMDRVLGPARTRALLVAHVQSGVPELMASAFVAARRVFSDDVGETEAFNTAVLGGLTVQLSDADPARALAAARGLQQLGDLRAVPALVAIATNQDLSAPLRAAAAPKLENFPIFRGQADEKTSDRLNRGLDQGFAQRGDHAQDIQDLARHFSQLALSPDANEQHEALRWLSRLGPLDPSASKSVLARGLEHPDADVRMWTALQMGNPATDFGLYQAVGAVALWGDSTGVYSTTPPFADSHRHAFERDPGLTDEILGSVSARLADPTTSSQERIALYAVVAQMPKWAVGGLTSATSVLLTELDNPVLFPADRLALLGVGAETLPASVVVEHATSFLTAANEKTARSLAYVVGKAIEAAPPLERVKALRAVQELQTSGEVSAEVASAWRYGTGVDSAHVPELIELFNENGASPGAIRDHLTQIDILAFNRQVIPNVPDLAARLKLIQPERSRLALVRRVLGHSSRGSSPEAITLSRQLLADHQTELLASVADSSAAGVPQTRSSLALVMRGIMADDSLTFAERQQAADGLAAFGIDRNAVPGAEREQNIRAISDFHYESVDTAVGREAFGALLTHFEALVADPLNTDQRVEDFATVLTRSGIAEGISAASRFRTEKALKMRELAVTYMNENAVAFTEGLPRFGELAALRDGMVGGDLKLEATPDGKSRFDADFAAASGPANRYANEVRALGQDALTYFLDPEVSESLGALSFDDTVMVGDAFSSLADDVDKQHNVVTELTTGRPARGSGLLEEFNRALHEEERTMSRELPTRHPFMRQLLGGDQIRDSRGIEFREAATGHQTKHSFYYPQKTSRAVVKGIHGIEAAVESMSVIGSEINALRALESVAHNQGALARAAARSRVLMRALRVPFVRSDAVEAVSHAVQNSHSSHALKHALHKIELPANILRGVAGVAEVVFLAAHPELLEDPKYVIYGAKGAAEAVTVGSHLTQMALIHRGAAADTLAKTVKWTGRVAGGLGVAAGLYDMGKGIYKGRVDTAVVGAAEASGYALLMFSTPGLQVAGAAFVVGATVYHIWGPTEIQRKASDLGYNVDANWVAEMGVR